MLATTLTYASHDGSSTIRALLWEPETAARPDFEPRGVVQLVHGMSEHVERYAPFAQRLCEQGFAVCANDHVGHGKSAGSAAELGHLPLNGGKDVLVEDVHTLRETVCSRYPAAPYVIFGHSMGSFVTRVYLTRHGAGVAAAVVCGTGQQPRAQSSAGKALTSVLARLHGERYVSKLVCSMGTGAYAKAVEMPRTDVDWIATDPEVVDAYVADPLCGQDFTVGGYHTLACLVADATNAKLARKVPSELPMLFIAGGEDPVGDCGKGVKAAAREYRRAGVRTVEEIIYPGVRHEILNEPIKEQVYADVEQFLKQQGI